jgi:hypothetical protein
MGQNQKKHPVLSCGVSQFFLLIEKIFSIDAALDWDNGHVKNTFAEPDNR